MREYTIESESFWSVLRKYLFKVSVPCITNTDGEKKNMMWMMMMKKKEKWCGYVWHKVKKIKTGNFSGLHCHCFEIFLCMWMSVYMWVCGCVLTHAHAQTPLAQIFIRASVYIIFFCFLGCHQRHTNKQKRAHIDEIKRVWETKIDIPL